MYNILQFIKNWMLPLAIMAGVTIAVTLHCTSEGADESFASFAKGIQPVTVAAMLFLQFVRISPHDLQLKPFHIKMLAFQLVLFAATAWLALRLTDETAKILAECAMLCFICPTAAAAGVITGKLGGSLPDTISYVVVINILAATAIPLVIPIVNPSSHMSFLAGFAAICAHTFPMLVLPLALAWVIRYWWRSLQKRLMRYTEWAFYLWGVSLTLAIYLSTRALLCSDITMLTGVEICGVSLAACLIQFAAGHAIGGRDGKPVAITAGQSLGQKNTGFFIWIGYSYLTPVTSIAGGFYSLWQNIVNSGELEEQRRHKGQAHAGRRQD